jgi:hypothetical protein
VDKIGNVRKSQDVYLICGMVCLRQNHLWVHPSLNTTEMGTQVLERKSELLQLSWPECSYANLQSHLQPWCSSATGGRIQAGQGIHWRGCWDPAHGLSTASISLGLPQTQGFAATWHLQERQVSSCWQAGVMKSPRSNDPSVPPSYKPMCVPHSDSLCLKAITHGNEQPGEQVWRRDS